MDLYVLFCSLSASSEPGRLLLNTIAGRSLVIKQMWVHGIIANQQVITCKRVWTILESLQKPVAYLKFLSLVGFPGAVFHRQERCCEGWSWEWCLQLLSSGVPTLLRCSSTVRTLAAPVASQALWEEQAGVCWCLSLGASPWPTPCCEREWAAGKPWGRQFLLLVQCMTYKIPFSFIPFF